MTGERAFIAAALVVVACSVGGSAQAASSGVVVYPHTASLTPSDDFSVEVRARSGGWQAVKTYRALVDLEARSRASFIEFDVDGPVEVAVTSDDPIDTAIVRPRSLRITPTIDRASRTATFELPRPLNVSFEINGDHNHNLHVFTNPIERDAPKPDAPRVLYYGPGAHRIPGDHVLEIPSRTTLYLAPGAVLEGALWVKDATDVVIRGHGILNPSAVFDENDEEALQITDSSDIAVRDLTIIGSQDLGIDVINANRVTLAGIREINAARWSDGVNVQASRNVLIDGAFLRTSDDSIGMSASTPGGAKGSTRNVVVRNTTLWADVAHGILVGVQGNRAGGDVIDEIAFQNVDILDHWSDVAMYQGALAVNAGDEVLVSDVRFDDVRVEDFTLGQVVNLRVFLNPSYNDKPGAGIERILLRNVDYTGSGDRTSQVHGYDASREVRNVTFENLRRNGKVVLDPGAGNIDIGANTSNVVFRTQPGTQTWNDTRTGVRYTGRWAHVKGVEAYRRDWHATRTAGSRATLGFTGRQARLYGSLSPATGKVDVWVDGAYRTTVDTYSPTRRVGQIWFDTGVLARGRHSIELRYRGARNLLSTGRAIQLDRIQVVS